MMNVKTLLAGLALAAIALPAQATIIDIGSQSGNTITDEVLATNWVRSDNSAVAAAGGSETMFIGTAGTSDFRGYLAFDLTAFSVGNTINSATVSIYSEGADTFDANGPSTADANNIGLNLTELVEITGTTIDVGGLTASYDNLVGGGDLYGAVIDTVQLNLDTIALDTQVDFDVTAAIQAAVDAGESKITFGLTSPDAVATGVRNFFTFGGVTVGSGGTDIGPNLNVDFVPEPASLALLGPGGLMTIRRRRK